MTPYTKVEITCCILATNIFCSLFASLTLEQMGHDVLCYIPILLMAHAAVRQIRAVWDVKE